MTDSEVTSNQSLPIRGMSAVTASMDKLMPSFSDITFWLVANVVLLLYVGIEELANGYGPGSYYSAGAVLLAVIYLLLWMLRKTNKKMADQWIMIISGLAVLGDLIVIGYEFSGSFSGGSALLDAVGLMLFRATYIEYRSP
ncbi:MAG: hypothetical protein JRM80_04115 [Nitrososphaerota archaeon]|nr:hypothetical protein [Nitrososphaerota archaeon]